VVWCFLVEVVSLLVVVVSLGVVVVCFFVEVVSLLVEVVSLGHSSVVDVVRWCFLVVDLSW
jgi:hypothetical protein